MILQTLVFIKAFKIIWFSSCPPGFIARPLCSATDAEVIDDLWPNHHEGSLFLIKRLIDWNLNMGIYVEATNELAAWCLR